MPVILNERVSSLLSDPGSGKILSSVSPDGVPHTVFKGSIHADSDGNIRYYELLETSRSNRNLTYAMWFGRSVSINVADGGGTGWQIVGKPVRALVSGAEFERVYVSLRETLGDDADLSAIWIIEPEEVREETFGARVREESSRHPLVGHLDRFVKSEPRVAQF